MKLSACNCRAEHYQRTHRSSWMKLVPSRRLYRCLGCNQMLFIRPEDAIGSPFRDTVIEPVQPRERPGRKAAA